MSEGTPTTVRTSTHWGVYDLTVSEGRITAATPFADDPDPSPIGNSIPGAVHHDCRVMQPMIRKGWLDKGPQGHAGGRGGGRGEDVFVPVSWDRALDLVAGELKRVREQHGSSAIFGGSYGWSSAGRFHHAQSQVHRFLNCYGGYTRSVDSYSSAAANVILPHILGGYYDLRHNGTSWSTVERHGNTVVMFGGLPMGNAQIDQGSASRHVLRGWLQRCKAAGVHFVNVSPQATDAVDFLDAQWLAPRPNSDTALMLGLAHTLVSEGLHDETFLARYCTGFEKFRPYLMGEGEDGQSKDADWAAEICGVPAADIRGLARRMAGGRTFITLSLSLQRADHGEQPYWMAVTLSAMLGQWGLPGAGLGWGYGAFNSPGAPIRAVSGMALSQGQNGVDSFIPVARIVDMLNNPGQSFQYNGRDLTYPDVRLIYWAGGNPFHHHQDINALVAAWQKPETIIVNEPWWTATARHADIVLPATTPYERNDISRSATDAAITAMKQAVSPVGEARNDYDIFCALAGRLGVREEFSEGRNETEWLQHLYERFRQNIAAEGLEIPDFETFWEQGMIELSLEEEHVQLADFRADPKAHPIKTPSGRIEIFSETIASFGYDDCPGHPQWFAPREWLGGAASKTYPLHMVSPQPSTRLHSQLDCGDHSLSNKIKGREPVAINAQDAAERGISDGDLVRIFNDRGACLAGARVSADIRPGVIALVTGAWYDPTTPGGLEKHGNPNVLTGDYGTSRLAQGCSAQTVLVELEKFQDTVPVISAFDPPALAE